MGGIGVLIDPEQWDLGQRHLLYLRAVSHGSIHHAQEFIEQLPAFAERRANRPEIPIQSVFGAVPLSQHPAGVLGWPLSAATRCRSRR